MEINYFNRNFFNFTSGSEKCSKVGKIRQHFQFVPDRNFVSANYFEFLRGESSPTFSICARRKFRQFKLFLSLCGNIYSNLEIHLRKVCLKFKLHPTEIRLHRKVLRGNIIPTLNFTRQKNSSLRKVF